MLHPELTSFSLTDFPLWHKARRRRIPLAFELELTARCDNDCRHCYINRPAGDSAAQARELTVREIDDLAGQAAGLGSLWCLITGGEPLLRPDFADAYLALKRRGLLVSVFTNACLIDQATIDLFKRYPPRDIEVTVYGVTPATYEAVTRVPGSYDRFIVGLSRLESAGIKPRLKAMALTSNQHELGEIATFCRRYTKDYFRFDPQLHLRYDRDEARNAGIQSERLSPDDVTRLERADGVHHRAVQKECARISAGERTAKGRGLFLCRAGLDSFTIGWDGTFKLCGALTDPSCTADLRTMPLREAWGSFAPSLRKRKPGGKRFGEMCGKCDLVSLCLWCPAHAYLETGKLDQPVTGFCAVARARRGLFP
jgi:radical SAM protein with 4Fe4S-binding SPASM domain